MATDVRSDGVEWKLPRRFHLVCNVDRPGVLKVGTVAEGAVWSSGAVALHSPGYPQFTSFWSSIHDVLKAHVENGMTELEWIDDGPEIGSSALEQPKQPERDSRGWPVIDRHECTGVGE